MCKGKETNLCWVLVVMLGALALFSRPLNAMTDSERNGAWNSVLNNFDGVTIMGNQEECEVHFGACLKGNKSVILASLRLLLSDPRFGGDIFPFGDKSDERLVRRPYRVRDVAELMYLYVADLNKPVLVISLSDDVTVREGKIERLLHWNS